MTIRPNNWNKQIKDVIRAFSDIHWQKNAFHMKEGKASSPDEMCCWPDDFLMEEWIQENISLLSIELQRDFRKFFHQIEIIPEDKSYKSPDDAIQAPEWIEMRHLASSILIQLQKIPELNK